MPQSINPLISVVMCVYNGEKYLDEAIKSILNQSLTDFEFIIINDGSTDNTEDIILSYSDPRIKYIRNEVNLKIIKSSNKGVDLARGKFIARMDADDISLPDRFKKQIDIFNLYPGIDIVNANAYFLTEDGTKYREQKSLTITFSFESLRFLIYLQNFIYNPTVMVRSDQLKKYRYIDDELREHIEDYDLWARMLKDGCICYTIEDRLVLYRDNSVSINHTYKSKQVEKMSLLCSNLLEESFNFKIDEFSFKALLAEGGMINYSLIKRLNEKLMAYNSLIKNRYSISTSAYNELGLWRKQKIILICLKSFKHVKLIEKIGVLRFLLCHLNWFINKNVITLIKRSFYTKYWSVQPDNLL